MHSVLGTVAKTELRNIKFRVCVLNRYRRRATSPALASLDPQTCATANVYPSSFASGELDFREYSGSEIEEAHTGARDVSDASLRKRNLRAGVAYLQSDFATCPQFTSLDMEVAT